MQNLTERIQACYSVAVYDVLRGRGRDNCVLPPDICGLDPQTRFAGPVFTSRGVAFDQQRDADVDCLLPWVKFLAAAPAGHVVVCRPNSDRLALMGELSAETLEGRGILGYILDGGSRDNMCIQRIGFPVFCRFRTPRDIVGKWTPDATGVPITIGDVLIRSGDYYREHQGVDAVLRATRPADFHGSPSRKFPCRRTGTPYGSPRRKFPCRRTGTPYGSPRRKPSGCVVCQVRHGRRSCFRRRHFREG